MLARQSVARERRTGYEQAARWSVIATPRFASPSVVNLFGFCFFLCFSCSFPLFFCFFHSVSTMFSILFQVAHFSDTVASP